MLNSNWAFLFILALSYSVTTLSQAKVISRAPVNSEDNEKNPLDPTEERMIFDTTNISTLDIITSLYFSMHG